MKRRAEYEEDMYIRLALTKEDKKRLNRKEREVDELQVKTSVFEFGFNLVVFGRFWRYRGGY